MLSSSIQKIAPSELVLNKDGSVYHINLKPEDIADNVLVVGDQNRVEMISSFFDTIEIKKQSREFVTHTGTYNGKRVTALSTGIGTDNIDIVINELDAAVNIDLENRVIKKDLRSLNIIRIGTCGGMQSDVPVESYIASKHGLGFDGVMHFYDRNTTDNELQIEKAFSYHMGDLHDINKPYLTTASDKLLGSIAFDMKKGITLTANGFYGPQGRVLRLPLTKPNWNDLLTSFEYEDLKICNYEMETSTLYGLCNQLNHNCLTVCLVVANRVLKAFSKDYKPHMKILIKTVLDRL